VAFSEVPSIRTIFVLIHLLSFNIGGLRLPFRGTKMA
jgi:hypothetical protein